MNEEFLKKVQDKYGRHITAIYCLVLIYKYMQEEDRNDDVIWAIEDLYEYFVKHFASEVLNKGTNVLKLYTDITKEMKKLC